MLADVVVNWTVSLALVGRTGADAVAVVGVTLQVPVAEFEVELAPEGSGHVFPVSQTRSVGQQPPPRLIGQD
jgi:hypothetical protein